MKKLCSPSFLNKAALISFKQLQGVVITGHNYFPAVFCIDGRDITHFALDEQHRASPCAGMLRPFGALTISIAGH